MLGASFDAVALVWDGDLADMTVGGSRPNHADWSRLSAAGVPLGSYAWALTRA